MESRDSPALRQKGVKVVHVKQCKAGRILFKKKTEITSFTRQTYILMKIVRASIS
jgi:hypothetical protein